MKIQAELAAKTFLISTFIPESDGLIIVLLGGLLTCSIITSLPAITCSGMICNNYIETYSSGYCLGFSPNSLF